MKSDWGRGIVVVVMFLSPTIHGLTKSYVKNLEAIDRWP
jgi:hypothetical protein